MDVQITKPAMRVLALQNGRLLGIVMQPKIYRDGAGRQKTIHDGLKLPLVEVPVALGFLKAQGIDARFPEPFALDATLAHAFESDTSMSEHIMPKEELKGFRGFVRHLNPNEAGFFASCLEFPTGFVVYGEPNKPLGAEIIHGNGVRINVQVPHVYQRWENFALWVPNLNLDNVTVSRTETGGKVQVEMRVELPVDDAHIVTDFACQSGFGALSYNGILVRGDVSLEKMYPSDRFLRRASRSFAGFATRLVQWPSIGWKGIDASLHPSYKVNLIVEIHPEDLGKIEVVQ